MSTRQYSITKEQTLGYLTGAIGRNFLWHRHLEHPLKLGRVFEATGLLQLGDHGSFSVVARRHVLHESLGQHLAVKLLEDVLVFDVLEHHHLKTWFEFKDYFFRLENVRPMLVSFKLVCVSFSSFVCSKCIFFLQRLCMYVSLVLSIQLSISPCLSVHLFPSCVSLSICDFFFMSLT